MNGLTFPASLRKCFADVYEPAEDSFFLLDSLESELLTNNSDEVNAKTENIHLALELCCGSGIISVNLARRLPKVCFFCTDINPSAARLTDDVARLSSCAHNVNVVLTNMCCGLLPRLARKVDLLYCNPPYVPTEDGEEEADHSLIGLAWAGGKNGVEAVVDQFLPTAAQLLSETGVAFLLVLDKNMPEEIVAKAEEDFSLNGKVIVTRRFFNEKLSIVKFWRC